jgi:uncharacterized DUF497 family protein
MIELKLNPDNRQDHSVFVDMLDKDRVHPLPDELDGIQYSRNGKCQWYKKKAYVNRWKHGVSFEQVSRLFEDPLPSGYSILYEEWDPHSTGVSFGNYDDDRDRLIARIDPRHYVVVKVDPGSVRSGMVHILSARYADPKLIEKALSNRYAGGSSEVFQSVLRDFDNYDYFSNLPRYRGDVTKFAYIYSVFKNGDLSVPDAVARLEVGGFGLTFEQAESIVQDWLRERNVNYLAKLM